MVVGRREETCHELDDVDAEVLVDHGAEPDACAGEPVQHLCVGRVDDELHLVLQSNRQPPEGMGESYNQ